MPKTKLICILLFCCNVLFAGDKKSAPMPNSFVIGRHTSIDVGPPFDYYEIISARSAENRTLLQKITLTPAGDACVQPAKIKVVNSSVSDSISSLLKGRNPCSIPERTLKDELKRGKGRLVFSSAEISMRVLCVQRERIIHAEILDRDMFDASPNTPENTEWIMRILGRLDKALGKGVLDQPEFPDLNERKHSSMPDQNIIQELESGSYDYLFRNAPDKPSDLYRATQVRLPVSDALLISSIPFNPDNYVSPKYPIIAKLARIEGTVVVTFKLDESGRVRDVVFVNGHPMLRSSVEKAVSEWVFPEEAFNQQITATIEFKTNCPAKPNQ